MRNILYKHLICGWSWVETIGGERKAPRFKPCASKHHELGNNVICLFSIACNLLLCVREHMIPAEGFLDGKNS